jgi:hypothetical protein
MEFAVGCTKLAWRAERRMSLRVAFKTNVIIARDRPYEPLPAYCAGGPRSRSTGLGDHFPPESVITFDRNMHVDENSHAGAGR